MTWNELTNLVERAKTGDRLAYGELVERFQPTVYALALARLRNTAEAEELAQDVFLHVMRKISQLRDVSCFAGWLRQITVRMAINRITRHSPLQGGADEVLQNAPAEVETPLDEMLREEQKRQLWKGLERLKETDRDTLVAFYIRGHSLKRMSRDFASPVGTIKRRLHVARNRLRAQLERQAQGKPRQKRRRRKAVCV
jgi:RNA polymerase sigma-70 factor (ECF subfamily)